MNIRQETAYDRHTYWDRVAVGGAVVDLAGRGDDHTILLNTERGKRRSLEHAVGEVRSVIREKSGEVAAGEVATVEGVVQRWESTTGESRHWGNEERLGHGWDHQRRRDQQWMSHGGGACSQEHAYRLRRDLLPLLWRDRQWG